MTANATSSPLHPLSPHGRTTPASAPAHPVLTRTLTLQRQCHFHERSSISTLFCQQSLFVHDASDPRKDFIPAWGGGGGHQTSGGPLTVPCSVMHLVFFCQPIPLLIIGLVSLTDKSRRMPPRHSPFTVFECYSIQSADPSPTTTTTKPQPQTCIYTHMHGHGISHVHFLCKAAMCHPWHCVCFESSGVLETLNVECTLQHI